MENHRAIRSFVLRQGRLTPAQQRAVETLLPLYGIPYAAKSLDLERAFGRAAPKILEIGFGMGTATAQIAAANPDKDYLGIEVHTPGVGNLLKLMEEQGLANLRLIQHDAVEVLRHMIAAASLDGVHIFFPDPWPKKRHHKRRLVQPAFAALAARKLSPGGVLHAATDWPHYAEQIAVVFEASECFTRADAGLVVRPETKFETRGKRLGHPIRDLFFRRR